jgi:hypothetical protein
MIAVPWSLPLWQKAQRSMLDLVPTPTIDRVRAAELDKQAAMLPATRVLHHLYRSSFAPESFNPGFGSGRFHPFQDANGQTVPVYYAASSIEGAFCETLFRAMGDGLHACQQVSGKLVSAYSHAKVRLCQPLQLARLSGSQLLRLGLTRAALLEPGPLHYPATAAWAQAIHAAYPALHGLSWVSRQHDLSTCYMLFGDRVAANPLAVMSTLDLASAAGQGQSDVVAQRLGVVIVR